MRSTPPGAKWVAVSNMIEIRLYGVGHGRQAYERWDLRQVREVDEYRRLMLLLSGEGIIGHRALQILAESAQIQTAITSELYNTYSTPRRTIINTIRRDNSQLDPLDIISGAQTILDLIFFCSFC